MNIALIIIVLTLTFFAIVSILLSFLDSASDHFRHWASAVLTVVCVLIIGGTVFATIKTHNENFPPFSVTLPSQEQVNVRHYERNYETGKIEFEHNGVTYTVTPESVGLKPLLTDISDAQTLSPVS